jgi:hypothetical protein
VWEWAGGYEAAVSVMTFDLLLIGAAIAPEPIPLTGYILLRSTEGGNWKGYGFILGWIVTLVLIIVLMMVLTGGNRSKRTPRHQRCR